MCYSFVGKVDEKREMEEKELEKLPSLGELMADNSLSFTDVHEISGVSRSTIEDLVYGKRKSPQPKTMREIAKVFGLEARQIREFARAIEERKKQLGSKIVQKN